MEIFTNITQGRKNIKFIYKSGFSVFGFFLVLTNFGFQSIFPVSLDLNGSNEFEWV